MISAGYGTIFAYLNEGYSSAELEDNGVHARAANNLTYRRDGEEHSTRARLGSRDEILD